ncbi:RNA-directed DNA polymerase [Mycolicibacterium elephantis]
MASLGLDLEQARQLSAMEIYGDWYRDPWGWPEVLTPSFIAKIDAEAHLGIDRKGVQTSLDPFFHRMEVPKSFLGVRPAVVQDPMSRLAYNAAVLKGVGKLHADLQPWVFGWRLRDGKVSKNKPEWSAYVESLPAENADGHGLVTDITSFFASIDVVRLLEIVGAAAGKTVPREIIAVVVDTHSKMLGRSGLPQRSFASAILANCYLQPIDDALNAASTNWDILRVRRWMDDISAEGHADALYGLLLDLQDRARQTGLELNSAKTHLTGASETARDLRSETLNTIEVEFRKMKLSEYSDEEVEVAVNDNVLVDLEREILNEPDAFGRPVIRSVLHSLTKYELFDNSLEWRTIAHRVPHVADNLGRYLRGAMDNDDEWFGSEVSECAEWFMNYVGSTYGRQNWVTSQFALAFDDDNSPRIKEVLVRWLDSSLDLQQVAIAAERLGAMDPSYARYVMTARADGTSDPLLLRIFALGLLRARADRATVSAILERDKRNALLAHYLEVRSWEPPPVSVDFGGSEDDHDEGTGSNV